MKRFLLFFTTICLVLIALPCQAAYMTYNSEAAFIAAAGPVGFESFETLPPSNTATDFFNTVSTTDFSVHTTQQFMQIWGDPPVSFAPHGDQVLFWYALTQGAISFDGFGGGIYSFGLYISDWANYVDPGNLAELIFVNDIGDAVTIASTSTGLGDYNELFFGIVSDTPFNSVTLTTTNDDGWVFFDKVYTGDPIPEPATILLFGLGLLGVAGISRKDSGGIDLF